MGNIGPDYFPGVTDPTPLYATHDGGASWGVLGAGLPNVPVYSLGYRALTRSLVAFTWGRSAWEMPFVPAARVSPPALALHVARGDKEAHAELIIDDAEAYGSEVEVTVTTDTPWLAKRSRSGLRWGSNMPMTRVPAASWAISSPWGARTFSTIWLPV